jgi:hypothetical protein
METRSAHNDSSDNYNKKNEANTRPFQLAHHSSDDEQKKADAMGRAGTTQRSPLVKSWR